MYTHPDEYVEREAEKKVIKHITDHIKMFGQTVVFTGFRSKELEQAIEAAGGKIGTTISTKTTLLVTNDTQSISGKVQKARVKGIQIIDEAELRSMLQ